MAVQACWAYVGKPLTLADHSHCVPHGSQVMCTQWWSMTVEQVLVLSISNICSYICCIQLELQQLDRLRRAMASLLHTHLSCKAAQAR